MVTKLDPTYRSTKTILGQRRELQAYRGVTPTFDLRATINHKRQVLAATVATNRTVVRYYGVGIGGSRNVDDGNLTKPNEVSMLNMDLYTPIPIRVVPVEQDLSPQERMLYRMRVPEIIGGKDYFCYYFKVLEAIDSDVRITKTSEDGLEVNYPLDYTNLRPTPPTGTTNGTVGGSGAEVNVTIAVGIHLTGAEIAEAVAIKYGDLNRAKLTELGIYSGEDVITTGKDINGTEFQYTEAVCAQLEHHYTWNGVDMSNPKAILNKVYRFGTEDLLDL